MYISKYKLYLFLLLIPSFLFILPDTIQFSVDNSTIDLSDGFKSFNNQISTNNQKVILGHQTMTSVKGSTKKVDKNFPVLFKVPYYNSDTAGDRLQLLMGAQSGDLVPYNKLQINHTTVKGIIPSKPEYYVPNVVIEGTPQISCIYNQSTLNYTINTVKNTLLFDQVEKHNYYSFGRSSSKVYYLEYNDNKEINPVELSTLETGNSKQYPSSGITKFFVGGTNSQGYIFIILNNNDILIFSIVSNIMSPSEISITYYDTISSSNVIKVHYYNKKVYYLTDTQIFEYNIETKTPSNEGVSQMKDFVVYSDYIFFINDNAITIHKKGTTSSDNTTTIYNNSPHALKKIDLFTNPFTGYEYIGISFEQGADGEEFFAEFLLNQGHLQLNKVFTSQKGTYLPFFNLDSFFSLFYNTDTNKLYLIRRAMLNSAPFQTYFIDFSDIIETNSENPKYLSSFYNKTEEKSYPVLITDKNYYVITNLTLPEHLLNCSFNIEGSIILRFIQYGDACKASIKKDETKKYNICEKLVDFNFYIETDKEGIVRQIVLVVLVFFAIILIIIIIIIFKETHCCKTNKNLKLTKEGVNKDNREKLYQEEEEEEDSDSDDDDWSISEDAYINRKRIKITTTSRHTNIPSSGRGLMDDPGSSTSRRSNNDDLIEENDMNIITNKIDVEKNFNDEKNFKVQKTQTVVSSTTNELDTKLYSKTKFN